MKQTGLTQLLLMDLIRKKIYNILDATHIFSESCEEKDFVIPFDMLEKAFYSYFKQINKIEEPFIIIFENVLQNSKIYNFEIKTRIILDVLESFKIDSQIESLNKITNVKEILNFSKIKKNFLKLIISEIMSDRNDNIKIELLDQVSEICDEWDILTFKLAKNILAEKDNYNITISSSLRKKEADLIRKLINLVELSSNNETSFFETENNNGIISFVDNNIFFNFTGDKIYNSWFSDDSPKVILSKNSNFNEIELSVSSNIIGPRFVAGLFIRFNNDLYYFGLDSGRRIIVDISGKNSQFAFENVSTNKIFQKVIFNEDSIACYYKLSEQEEYIFLTKILLEFGVEFEYGVGCKTYESPFPLRVQINVL